MRANRDSRFIRSVAPFDHVLSDFTWPLSRNSATPFSDFFGLPMVSRTPSATRLTTDMPTPLSSVCCFPMLSHRRPGLRLWTGLRLLSRRAMRLGTGRRYLSLG